MASPRYLDYSLVGVFHPGGCHKDLIFQHFFFFWRGGGWGGEEEMCLFVVLFFGPRTCSTWLRIRRTKFLSQRPEWNLEKRYKVQKRKFSLRPSTFPLTTVEFKVKTYLLVSIDFILSFRDYFAGSVQYCFNSKKLENGFIAYFW